MKKNRKLMLMTGMMLAVTAVATSTATYAWISMNKNAYVGITNVGATSEGDLEIMRYTPTGTSFAPSTVDNNWTTRVDLEDEEIILTDISGDGVDFFKPTFDTDEGTTYGENDIISVREIDYEHKEGFFVDYDFILRHKREGKIYMGSATAITDSTPEEVEHDGGSLYKAARVAVFESNLFSEENDIGGELTVDERKVVIASKDSADVLGKYVSSYNDASGYELFHETFNADVLQSDTNDTFFREFINRTALDAEDYGTRNNKFSPVIADLSIQTETPDDYYYALISIRIWIEGTDEQSILANVEHIFDVELHFYCILNDEI